MSTDVQVIDEFRKECLKVSTTSQALQVPVGSYYRCCNPQEDGRQKPENWECASLVERIKNIQSAHHAWGYRRSTAVLRKASGSPLNRKKAYRSVRPNDLLAYIRQHRSLNPLFTVVIDAKSPS